MVFGLALWATASSLRIYPHSMSYFNELAGGPENGHAHLVDSNIDWGQDVFFLKRWLDAHPEARPIPTAVPNIGPGGGQAGRSQAGDAARGVPASAFGPDRVYRAAGRPRK